MSRFNTNTTHPLIPNANEYMFEQQYVSIHSEDRNVLRYPNSCEFEIELPQDYLNVQGIKLSTWTFPSNYNTFSLLQNNITMTFQITTPYNPGDHDFSDPLLDVICDALNAYKGNDYVTIIQEGFYNPTQIANELTNRFNQSVTVVVAKYISINAPLLLDEFNLNGGYTQFVIVYNEVGQKLWFGNKSSEFFISNDSEIYLTNTIKNILCFRQPFTEYSNWGLPSYLGFTKCNVPSTPGQVGSYPRFCYGDVIPGDGGYWLLPDVNYVGAIVYYLEVPFKINLMGNSYLYLEIDGMNVIDETIPYAINEFNTHTNETSGVVKASFAKIPIVSTPVSQWFDNSNSVRKIYNPPAERIRKMKIKLRYHNGVTADFGKFEYSLLFEFTIFKPQAAKKYNMYIPESIVTNS
jgi:hypothetical protein